MYKEYMSQLAKHLDVQVASAPIGFDYFLPFLNKITSEGSVFLVKFDGQRVHTETGAYTALVSGGKLGDGFFRTDNASLEEALSFVVVNYAKEEWGFEFD